VDASTWLECIRERRSSPQPLWTSTLGNPLVSFAEMFGYAKDHQPCVIFTDEIDAIGGKRYGDGTSAGAP